MSSDLWSAFGGGSDDLASNPWAQPVAESSSSQHENKPQTQADQTQANTSQIKVAAYTDSWTPSIQKEQTPWAESTDSIPAFSGPDKSDFDVDPWSVFEKDHQSLAPDPAYEDQPFRDVGNSSSADHLNNVQTSMGSLEIGKVDDDDDEDDDFGAFEDAEQISESTSHEAQVNPILRPDTSGRATMAMGEQRPQHHRSQSVQIYDPYADLDLLAKPRVSNIEVKSIEAIKAPEYKARAPHKRTALVEELVPYSADEWGEFSPDPTMSPRFVKKAAKSKVDATKPPQISSQHARSRSEPPLEDRAALKTTRSSKMQESSSSALPPTNVPPPSILMSLVSGLVQKLPTQVETVMQSPATSNSSQKALENALRRCLASLRVAARIIAGRKVRWKRDTILSQSMKIGPAVKSGGMKLVGVDKAELKREDREAAEFVRIWQQNLGSIRSALATVNSQIAGKPLALPEISASMLIRVLKGADGGITALKCCALCGIKREERIEKVDVDVWDSFREYWTDNWGHTECKGFWQEHEQFLQARR